MTTILTRNPTSLSGREARTVLRLTGMGDRQARELLASGLAGTPRREGATDLYDEHRVAALAGRPTLRTEDLCRHCPSGWFVARRNDAARLRSRGEQLEALSDGWAEISIWTRILLRAQIADHGPLPFIATVAGHVYLGADLVEFAPGARLVLADAGAWFDRVRGTRVPTGRGRPWHVRLVETADSSAAPTGPCER